jgi:hypothetical protein
MTGSPKHASPKLAHCVYFALNDGSGEAKRKLIDSCKTYLAGHPGTVFFAVGARAEEYARSVNDREFDVAWTIVFEDTAAHDEYQKSERHLKFIEENKDNWKSVRVCDSFVVE